MYSFNVNTAQRVELIDITSQVQSAVSAGGLDDGLCMVFVPHTTAGVTINENADPDVRKDIIKELNALVPFNDGYSHSEGNSAAHIKASLVGFSLTLCVERGRVQLGTWQGIYFAEFDGPRKRTVWVKILK